jgi:hypothetical protein
MSGTPPLPRGKQALVARETLRVLTREILERKALAAKTLYEIGARLNRINEEQLFVAGGFEHFGDYLEVEVGISARTARRFMRIARHFNARIAARYGSGKLDAALRYMETTPEDERPGDLLSAEIRLRNERGQYETLSLHEATESEIREATALMMQARDGGKRIPKTLRRKTDALAKAMPTAPTGTGRGDRVKLSRGKDGRLAASFLAIPLDELDGFLKAVRTHLA